MIKKIAILAYLLFFSVHVFSQRKPNLDSLINQFNNAIEDSVKIKTSFTIGNYYINSMPDSALKYLNKALQIAEKNNYYEHLAKIHGRIGSAFFYTSNFDRVLTHYYKSLEYLQKKENKQELLSTFFNIGLVYNSLNNYDKSREYYEKALELVTPEVYPNDPIPMNQIKARILNNIGISYYSQQKPEEALKYYYEAIEISEEINFPYVISLAYNNIGNIYREKESFDIALSFYNKSIQIRKQTKDFKGIALTYFYIAETLKKSNQPYEAIQKYQNAYNIADSTHYIELKKVITESLIEEYAKIKDYKKSYEMHITYKALTDSINFSTSLQKATQLEMQYKFDQIQKEQELAQQRREFKYVILLIISIGLFLTLALLYFIARGRTKRIRLKQEKLKLEKENLENKLEFKNKELASNVMNLVRYNELAIKVTEKLMHAKADFKKSNQSIIQDIINELKTSTNEEAWKEFEIRFKQVHEDFYDKLGKQFPDLTPNEIRLCAFLRLNMTSKEISAITFQSIKSIEVARTRLRKKLNLVNTDTNLVSFLMTI